jgi:hypothetical protein
MAKRNNVEAPRRNVVYHPPATASIYKYTRDVCKELGETVDPSFDTPDMHSEIANFIKVVAEIGAEQMNKRTVKLDSDLP